MNKPELKTNLHKSIDAIENVHILQKLKYFFDFIIKNDNVDFWDELSEEEKAEINQALFESQNEKNLVPHDQVMKKLNNGLQNSMGKKINNKT